MPVPGYKTPGTTTAITPKAKSSSGFWGSIASAIDAGWDWLTRAAKDVGAVFSPIVHDVVSFGASLAPGGSTPSQAYDASRLIKPIASEVVRRTAPYSQHIADLITGKKPLTLGNIAKGFVWNPKLLEGSTYSDPGKLLRTIAGDTPAGLVLPGLSTAAALTTKSGRNEALYKHPGFTIMDILPIVGKLKPALSGVTRTLGRGLTSTEVGASAAARMGGALAKYNPRGAATAAPAWSISRKALTSNIMRDAMETVFPKLKGLNEFERFELTQRLHFADPPAPGTLLRDAYDAYAAHQEISAVARQRHPLPEPYEAFLKHKALLHKRPGAELTQVERLERGLQVSLGLADEAVEPLRIAVQAFFDGAPNPFPTHPAFVKVWEELHRITDAMVKRHRSEYPLYEEPITGSLFTKKQISKLRKAVGGKPGRGANLSKVAEDLVEFQDAPPPAAILAKRAELESALNRTPTTAGHWEVDIDPRGRYWARSTTPDHPHLGPFDDASSAAKAVRDHVRDNAPEFIRSQLDELDELTNRLERVNRYKQTVAGMTPARYKPMLEAYIREARANMDAARVSPDMAGAYKKAADEITASLADKMFDAALKGKKPIYVHREALAGPSSEGRTASFRARTPSSSKPSEGLAKSYVEDAGWAMFKDEAEWAIQHAVLETVPEIWFKDGARSWVEEVAKLKEKGFRNAEGIVKDKFSSIEFDKSGKVKIGEARDGAMLVTKATGYALEKVFNPEFARGFWNKSLGIWIAPTLGLSPVFQMNNVFGGAVLYGLRAGGAHLNPVTLLRDMKAAISMALSGEILDPRIPMGTGLNPKFSKYMSPLDEAKAAGWYGEGLGSVWRHWYSGNPIEKALRFTDRLNKTVDAFYKNMTAMSHSKGWRAVRNMDEGVTGVTDEAIIEASRLLQNMEAMTPFEREVMQRVIPFWTWKRTLLQYATKYPIDHPLRLTVLNQMAKLHEEQREVAEYIDEYLLHYVPIGEKDRENYQMMLSLRGMDPFADFSNMATLKGWINSIHPVAMALLKVLGYDPFLGGVPAHARKEDTRVDPDTGAHLRKEAWDSFKEFIPQLNTIAKALDIEPPDQKNPEGWWRWWKKYGAGLRLLPGLQYINLQELEAKHLKPGEKSSYSEPEAPAGGGGFGGAVTGSSLISEAEVYTDPYRGGAEIITDTTPYANPSRKDASA